MNIYADDEVVVTGANGMLGRAVVKAINASDYYTAIPYESGFDITNVTDIIRLDGAKIINCAGIVRGHHDVTIKRMGEVNALGPHMLAAVAKRLIHVSTDCVFDGTKGPYVESDEPTPIDNYGMSKLMGEVEGDSSLTVRTSFVGFGQRGFLNWVLSQPYGGRVEGFRRWLWNGLYVNTVARQLVRLIDDPITGIVHIEGPIVSKYELIEMIIWAVRPDLFLIKANSDPKNMILKSERLVWGDAPDTTFSWEIMMAELKADYEVDQANQMLASSGDPEKPPGIEI